VNRPQKRKLTFVQELNFAGKCGAVSIASARMEDFRMHSSISVDWRLLLIVAGILGPTQLAMGQARAPAPAGIRGGVIDTELSRVFIFVDKTGFGHQHGVVGRLKEGSLRVAREGAGRLVFDMPSFRADTEEARRRVGLEGASSEQEQEQVTANMLGASVLDVEHFPTALFVVASVRRLEERDPSGKSKLTIDGDFTLHGVTRRVRITAIGAQERGFLHLKGSFPVRQTDYGIRPFKKALGAVGVADVLTVYGDLWVKP
jgi:polyisoprenoid-binding protein YceI